VGPNCGGRNHGDTYGRSPLDLLLRGVADGGIGAIHALTDRLGLTEAIDQRLVLFKFHLPYLESNHVRNIANNAFCEGTLVTDKALAHLQTSTSLQFLHVGHTKVTDAGLAHLAKLSKLQDLKLAATAVTDAGLIHLHKLSDLQRIELSDTKVSDAGANALQKALPKVKILR
jgi:Leucine Rich repeat